MTITVELTKQQLLHAIRRLPLDERLDLLQSLIKEDKEEINRRFDQAMERIHAANPDLNEDVVMAEINEIVHQIRAERYAASGR